METRSRRLNWTRDEILLALDLYFQVDDRNISSNDLRVIELSQYLNSLDLYPREQRNPEYRTPYAVWCRLDNFLFIETGKSRFNHAPAPDQEIWQEFGHDPTRLHTVAEAIRRNAAILTPEQLAIDGIADTTDEDEFPEGRVLLRTHQVRERNPKAVKQKKAAVREQTGKLLCEVCGFDFYAMYGDRGDGFIECHHTVPVAELTPGQKTRTADLALVCANCHRMLHRGGLISIDELRTVLENTALAPPVPGKTD
jgi:5-methylcytosine-specific restriction protein A